MTEKKIEIVCETGFDLALKDINNLQGDLKELRPENEAKLTNEILETGFSFAPHVWHDKVQNKYFLIDGHQRILVLKKLIADGYICGDIPVVIVQAASAEEAKRRVLQSVSQYGVVTNQGLYNFVIDANIDIDSLVASFNIPEIDLPNWSESYFPSEILTDEAVEPKDTEIEQGQFSKLVHTCPKCGFSFGAE